MKRWLASLLCLPLLACTESLQTAPAKGRATKLQQPKQQNIQLQHPNRQPAKTERRKS